MGRPSPPPDPPMPCEKTRARVRIQSMDHFTERQRLITWWLLAILLGTVGLFTRGLWVQFVRGQPWGSNPASDAILILMWLLAVATLVFFLLLELRTRIDREGIHIRMFPLHLKERSWSFDQLRSIEARRYSPLREYGGWGIRIGPNGWAYNARGSEGIQLVDRFGNRILIGTQDPEGFMAAVESARASQEGE